MPDRVEISRSRILIYLCVWISYWILSAMVWMWFVPWRVHVLCFPCSSCGGVEEVDTLRGGAYWQVTEGIALDGIKVVLMNPELVLDGSSCLKASPMLEPLNHSLAFCLRIWCLLPKSAPIVVGLFTMGPSSELSRCLCHAAVVETWVVPWSSCVRQCKNVQKRYD